jgi:universal stress protein E
MERIKSILLCVDVTARAFDAGDGLPSDVLSAIAETNWVAENSGASVTVMAVVVEEVVDAGTLDLARLRLKDTVVPLIGNDDGNGGNDGDVGVAVSHGTAFVEIIRKVLRDHHDLVVVAPRQTSLVHRTLVGSVSLHLLRKCPCPVLVAPRLSEQGPRVVLSAVALHELTPRVLAMSARVVELRGGRWHVFHCPEYPAEGGMRLRGASVAETEEYEAAVRKEAWDKLHELCDPLAEQTGVTPKFWMSEGNPSEQVGLAARELNADLVVLGTIGRSGLVGRLIGNTAEKVINSIECSILAVKPEGFVSPVTLED